MTRALHDGMIGYFDDFSDNPTYEYRFLSNFYVGEPLVIVADSQTREGWIPFEFQTGEHLFAALKAERWEDFEAIRTAEDPGKAKMLGRKVKLRADWEQNKYDAMALTLRTKFTMDRAEGQMLLDTGDNFLVEGTWWRDSVWGVALDSKEDVADPLRSPGRNWLGTLLMARRAELRAEKFYGIKHPTGYFNQLFSW